MKNRQILISLLIAIVGGFVAVFAYSVFFGKNERIITATVKQPVGFTRFKPDTNRGYIDFTYAAEKTIHAVVNVKTQMVRETYRNPILEFFYGDSYKNPEPVVGFGSGVIISADGYIVTNNHVVDNSDEVFVTLNDKREYEAKVIGTDPSTDLALIKIDADELFYIPYGNSDELMVGEWVLAVGNPFTITSTVTAGIVSAKGKNLGIIQDRYRIESFIQTDAAVNRGNSGGALVNTKGELVGINTAIISPSGAYAGISFAIPVSIVKKVIADLIEFGVVQRAILGVSIQEVDAELAKEKNINVLEGVYVSELRDGGAARDAGILEGDIILQVDGVKVNSPSELTEQINRYRPGDKVNVILKRKNKTKQFNVVLRNLQGDTKIVKSGSYDTILGAKIVEIDDDEKKSLGIKYGVKITELTAGKLRAEGVKEGFIITQINNKPVYSVEDLKKIVENIKGGVYIKGIYPNGVIAYYAFGM
ncbi:MAG: Do family serine endopeptidase [Bacteroidales bacterium]|nr:MAG: Do family serine endopeptidase [Bacteroidales bacterium]